MLFLEFYHLILVKTRLNFVIEYFVLALMYYNIY